MLLESGQFELDEVMARVVKTHPKINVEAIREVCNLSFRSLRSGGWALNPDAYFQLLEHEELQEARQATLAANKSAQNALNMARWALLISAVLAATSIIVQVFGIRA